MLSGGLSQEQVRRTIRRHVNEVRFCYEQGLQQNPSIEGRVSVRFIIANNGTVQYRERYRTGFDVVLGECFIGDELPLRVTIVLGTPTDAAAGDCSTTEFTADECRGNTTRTGLRCKRS